MNAAASLLVACCLLVLTHQFQIRSGTNGYVTYEVGGANSRVIISAPHGGTLQPDAIADRPTAGCYNSTEDECVYTRECAPRNRTKCRATINRDINTQRLAREIADRIASKLGGDDANRPHVIVNELNRIKLDANRDLAEAAFGDPAAGVAWHEFQGFVDDAKKAATGNGRTALYMDLHGQNQTKNWAMVGFLLDRDGWNGLDKSLIRDRVSAYSSIKQLHYDSGVSMEELVRGANSIGGLLQAAGYDTVPSPVNPDAGSAAYYRGGYNTRRYANALDRTPSAAVGCDLTAVLGSHVQVTCPGVTCSGFYRHTGWTVSGFQLEVHFDVLKSDPIRQDYADKVADAIIKWIGDYYEQDHGTSRAGAKPAFSGNHAVLQHQHLLAWQYLLIALCVSNRAVLEDVFVMGVGARTSQMLNGSC